MTDAGDQAGVDIRLQSLWRAISDDRVDRRHLKTLANITKHYNMRIGAAWPARERIAAAENCTVKTVENNLYDLRRWNYVSWAKKPDPNRPHRYLLHYTLTIEAEITAAVLVIREQGTRPDGDAKSPAQRVLQEKSTRPSGESPRPDGLKSTRPSGCKEQRKGTEREAAENTLPAKLTTDEPHMNGVGFIISANRNIHIPTATLVEWASKYTHIAIEPKVRKLAEHLRQQRASHVGWQNPAAWMEDLISQDNRRAKQDHAAKRPAPQTKTFAR